MAINIGNKMATGAVWMVLVRLIDRSVGVVSTIILARILVPADFGLVAMATAIGAILDILGAFSFDLALIQNPDAKRHHYDTVWTFNVLFGILCTVVYIVIASPAAGFYGDPRLRNVIYVLSLGNLINGFSNIGTVNFRKEMQFKDEFIMQFSRRIIMFIVTVVGAYKFRSYWGLVLGILAGRITGVIISYIMHTYRPKFSTTGWGDLINFSKWLFINNLSYFFNQRAADFIIGKMLGSHGLGVYSLSYEISNMPTSEIAAPINRAVFPGYAKMAHDIKELRKGYLNVLSVLALIAMPVGVGIALTSKYIVPVLLGNNWNESIPVIQILAIFGALNVIQNNCGTVYLALGDSRLATIFSVSFSVLLILFIILLIPGKGVMGVAWAYLITSGITVPVNFFIVAKVLGLNLKDYWIVMNRPIIASSGMAMIFTIWADAFIKNCNFASKVIPMVVSMLLGVVIYTTIIVCLWYIEGKPDGFETIFFRKFILKQVPQIA